MNPLTISFNAKTPTAIVKDPPARATLFLAHEIRNPLTNINLAVGMLEPAIQDADLEIYLQIIMRSSIRINDLVNELLKNHQAPEVQTEKHSIHQLLDEALEAAGDRIRLKNVAIMKDYTAGAFKIALNRPEIKIALTNIIINAIDAMASKNGELKLVTKLIEGKYALQIEDNGCGISKKDLKNIFKPFFSNKPGGLGLGLTTVHNILRSNHVGVVVESNEGEGTRFNLLFGERNRDMLSEKVKPGERLSMKEALV